MKSIYNMNNEYVRFKIHEKYFLLQHLLSIINAIKNIDWKLRLSIYLGMCLCLFFKAIL